jgi:hypothetical protein
MLFLLLLLLFLRKPEVTKRSFPHHCWNDVYPPHLKCWGIIMTVEIDEAKKFVFIFDESSFSKRVSQWQETEKNVFEATITSLLYHV